MLVLQKLCIKYGKTDARDFTNRQLQDLGEGLKSVSTEEINSVEQGEQFILLLSRFRMAVAANDSLHGTNYPDLLRSVLSVGEDGLYSNSLRFIFELIQNVDDCDFPSPEDCKLDMHFDFNHNQIMLDYNECGFTPFNVFSITGIAEAAKNLSSQKNEIGEKGIGFKSVFGVADKVLIQSGCFSFELSKDNFTVPVARYEGYSPIQGTKMTLFVAHGSAERIFGQLAGQYCNKYALFNKNPLLFLNKLTHLRFYYDAFRSLTFSVSRSNTGISDTAELTVEENVRLGANLRNTGIGGTIADTSTEIECIRYTFPVRYDREACQSRYGADSDIGKAGGKQMNLYVVVPMPEYVPEIQNHRQDGTGTLYSFLPTQVKLNVPLAIHVPFKLDASREYVDPQSNGARGYSKWFNDSCSALHAMLKKVYTDLANRIGEKIVYYLPKKNRSVFDWTNEKVRCLESNEDFKGASYLRLPVFYSQDGNFYPAEEVFCFDSADVKDPVETDRLIDWGKKLFVAPAGFDMRNLSVKIERNVYEKILDAALKDESRTEDCLTYLESLQKDDMAGAYILRQDRLIFSINQIQILTRHTRFLKLLNDRSISEIKNGRQPKYMIQSDDTASLQDYLPAGFELSDMHYAIRSYLKSIQTKIVFISSNDPDFFAAGNLLALSKSAVLGSFAGFCNEIDKKGIFASNLKIYEASADLNRLVSDLDVSDDEFMRGLREVRRSVKNALGDRGYKNYLKLIQDAGVTANRFINELLQNADDCSYPENETPTFILAADTKKKIIAARSNEVGFTRKNIRAITGIGDSTKKRLLNDTVNTIGEKGVGFKTVFAAASAVEIASGGFHFALEDKTPTIPKWLKPTSEMTGTTMVFSLKGEESFSPDDLTQRDILRLCLCLRKLKKIRIGKYDIRIRDSASERIVDINGSAYQFYKTKREFTIRDEDLLRERNDGGREISPDQYVCCYAAKEKAEKPEGYMLYCGLPTMVGVNVPMAIDAPLELTTSREMPVQSKWNERIRQEIYLAIVQMLVEHREEMRDGALKYISLKQVSGIGEKYNSTLFTDSWMNQFDFRAELVRTEFLPTREKDVFLKPNQKGKRFPAPIIYLLERGEYIEPLCNILDVGTGDQYAAVLNALGCTMEDFSASLEILKDYVKEYIPDETFRKKLYSFLKQATISHEDRTKLKEMEIIPVYPIAGHTTCYVSWNVGNVLTKQGADRSTSRHGYLNENILPKEVCEDILGVRIEEMNRYYERGEYQDELKRKISGMGNSPVELYRYIIDEYRTGQIQKYEAIGILRAVKALPMMNMRGDIARGRLLFNPQPAGYFSPFIERMCAAEEAKELAEELGYGELKELRYEIINIPQNYQLTEDDIESLQDSYFLYGEDMLRKFIKSGHVNEKMIELYHLEYLAGVPDSEYANYRFPVSPVRDRRRLTEQIRAMWKNPSKIVKRKVERTVLKVKYNGKEWDIDAGEIRDKTIREYLTEDRKYCFCQMCRKTKDPRYIEVNNIEREPDYYWPEMRVALCLDCSKWFKLFRNNDIAYDRFFENLQKADSLEGGCVDVELGSRSITFTQKHLAYIQDIINTRPENEKSSRKM